MNGTISNEKFFPMLKSEILSLKVCESSHGSISAISQFMFSRESLKLGKSVNDVNVNETFGFNLNFH